MRQNAFSRRPTINASRHLFHFDGVAESVLRNYDRFGAARRHALLVGIVAAIG